MRGINFLQEFGSIVHFKCLSKVAGKLLNTFSSYVLHIRLKSQPGKQLSQSCRLCLVTRCKYQRANCLRLGQNCSSPHRDSARIIYSVINPLNAELNPICYLLALLGAHHFLHVSRIRVKLLTFRLLMSCIHGAPILDVFRSHATTQHSR